MREELCIDHCMLNSFALGFIVRALIDRKIIVYMYQLKIFIFHNMNYVAGSRDVSYLSNKHTDASRAEPEAYCALQ